MSNRSEAVPATTASEGAVNGLVCAFALLVETLENNGALKPKQFQQLLGSVLAQPDLDQAEPDVAVLHQIFGLLNAVERAPLTVIPGGKS